MILHLVRRHLAAATLTAALLAASLQAQPFTPGNILATQNNRLLEYTPAGALVRDIPVPYPGGFPDDATDVVVDSSGRAHVLNINPFNQSYISTFDPSTGVWTHNPVNAFLGNVSDGDLSLLGQTLYTKNETISLVNFATTPLSLAGGNPRELSAGLDGQLYALGTGFPGANVRVIDPSNLSIQQSFNLIAANDARGIAATPSGDLYVADWNGWIYHFDSTGQNLLNTLVTGASNLLDIDISDTGTVVIGGRFGEVIVTNLALSSRTVIDTGSNLAYVGFVPQPAAARRDVGTLSIDAPVSGLGLTLTEDISITVANFGTTTESNFDIGYLVTGPTGIQAQTETFPGSLAPLTVAPFTFVKQVDLSIPGVYTVQVSTQLTGDNDPSNDSEIATVVHQPVITAFPYLQDFEVDQGGFITDGAASSWEYGAPAGTFISTAASGTRAWVTNLSGFYNQGELSYLVSPPFDCSGMTKDPFLEFSHIFQIDFQNESWVEVSINGNPFIKLGAANDPGSQNWYNDTFGDWWDGFSGAAGAWRTARHIIPGGAGNTVVVRWVLRGDTTFSLNEDGVGVDDVAIYEAPFGNGQRPWPTALLDVNGATEVLGFPVGHGIPGPYFSQPSASSNTLDIHFQGNPFNVVVLLGGSLNVGAFAFSGGQIDVSPFQVWASGFSPGGLNALFFTNANGVMDLSVTIPPALVGQVIAFQGLIATTDNAFATNAVEVTFVP